MCSPLVRRMISWCQNISKIRKNRRNLRGTCKEGNNTASFHFLWVSGFSVILNLLVWSMRQNCQNLMINLWTICWISPELCFCRRFSKIRMNFSPKKLAVWIKGNMDLQYGREKLKIVEEPFWISSFWTEHNENKVLGCRSVKSKDSPEKKRSRSKSRSRSNEKKKKSSSKSGKSKHRSRSKDRSKHNRSRSRSRSDKKRKSSKDRDSKKKKSGHDSDRKKKSSTSPSRKRSRSADKKQHDKWVTVKLSFYHWFCW